MTIDPVTLAVIENGLRQVCSEMDLVHEKTSFSPVISEAFDRSNGIYDRNSGEMISQGELGLPIFLGVMQFATQAVLEKRNDLGPGDVIIQNDPYLGGTHLMDVRFLKPFDRNRDTAGRAAPAPGQTDVRRRTAAGCGRHYSQQHPCAGRTDW